MIEVLLTATVTAFLTYLIKKIDGIEVKLDRVQEEVLFLSLKTNKRSGDRDRET